MKKIDQLNLVPFIDIVLVLLVIVLTTASFISSSRISVDIPKLDQSSNVSSEVNANDLIITIDKEGQFFLDDKKTSLEGLKENLSTREKSQSIVVNGDKFSNFNSFISLMDLLQSLEFSNLFVLVSENKE